MTTPERSEGGSTDNEGVDERGSAWFAAATSHWRDWDAAALAVMKGEHRVSVVLPARNEQATIGPIVEGIRRDLVERVPLVDELIVIDSDSTDDTARIAAGAGAVVHAAASIRPELGIAHGKGEAIWKSLFVTTGDLLVFIDADLTGWGTHFVPGLLGPLLRRCEVQHVKGFYDRASDDDSGHHAPQGGRVTELVARPLISLYRPELAAVVQPLAGEWAVRRSTLAALPVPVGYGVEIALLLDVLDQGGLDAIAQVDLGERAHVHQTVHDLGVMAAEVIATFGRRCGLPDTVSGTLWQYERGRERVWHGRDVPLTERPPQITVEPAVAPC